MEEFWKKCSSCKKEMGFQSIYYVCSVSTCRQKKTNYSFCSVPCWDGHIAIERHRGGDIAALERTSPSKAEIECEREKARSGRRVLVSSEGGKGLGNHGRTSVDGEVMVVASKVKAYVKDRSGMNTSASAMTALTEIVRAACDAAVQKAREDGRKTVMDRDFTGS